MATRAILLPLAAEFPPSNPYALTMVNQRPVLGFDRSASRTAYWTWLVAQGFVGPLQAIISYVMATATSGGVAFDLSLESAAPGDALNLLSASAFGAVNTQTNSTLPGTAGQIVQTTVNLSNLGGVAAGRYARLALTRNIANAADTATGLLYVLGVELRDAT